jgi:two-component system chemotaxis response regulator CheY
MKKVLVVDDSASMRKTIKKLLEKLGCKVVSEAKDGFDAIKKYKRYKPDFITMDISMPNMDGIEAVKKLIEIDQNIKIIMITSLGEQVKVMEAIIAGAKGYILKPLSAEYLKLNIDKVFPKNDDDKIEEILGDMLINRENVEKKKAIK